MKKITELSLHQTHKILYCYKNLSDNNKKQKLQEK